MSTAEKLRELMRTLDVNQSGVAALIGWTPASISNWICGRAKPGRVAAAKINELHHKECVARPGPLAGRKVGAAREDWRIAYQKGYKARKATENAKSPFGAGVEHWAWLAGWNDADMEAGVSYIGQLQEGRA